MTNLGLKRRFLPVRQPRLGQQSGRKLLLIGAVALSVAVAVVGMTGPTLAQGGLPRDWAGPRHEMGHGMLRGGMMFGPGSIERMVDHLVRITDASSEQKQKMNAIAQRAGADVLALRGRHLAGRQQLRELLAAPTIDRGKLEALRVEQMKLMDEASKHIAAAMADIAEVLTPIQREELARRMARHHIRRPL